MKFYILVLYSGHEESVLLGVSSVSFLSQRRAIGLYVHPGEGGQCEKMSSGMGLGMGLWDDLGEATWQKVTH